MEISEISKAKEIIRKGITKKITFQQLRELLPKFSYIELKTLIFDECENLGLDFIPFRGIMGRPQHYSKLQLDDGKLNIEEVLNKSGFADQKCEARAHIGKNKITITVKPAKKEGKNK